MNTQDSTRNQPFYRRYKRPIFVAILLLAAAGRIINIDLESLWVDEGFSYWAIRHDHMFDLIRQDVHPPVYFYMLRGWAGLAGISELALRYLSVIASLLSVAMIYHVARELERLRGTETESVVPTLAALLLALADMEIYIAQETRMYAWHVFWVIASMWAFLRFVRLSRQDERLERSAHNTTRTFPTMNTEHTIRSPLSICGEGVRGRGKSAALWIITSVLLLYTQYIGAAIIAVQGLYALLFLRGSTRRRAILALVVIGLAFVPWLLLVVGGQTSNVGTGFNVPSTLESLWNWRARWFTGQWALMVVLALLGLVTVVDHDTQDETESFSNPSPQIPPLRLYQRIGEGKRTPVSRGGVWDRFRGWGWRPLDSSFLMLLWLVVPVTGAYILNTRTPILMDYRLTQITPAVALLIAFGLGNLRPPALRLVLAAILIYGVTTDDAVVKRPPWRKVGQDAARYALPGDLALAHITPSGDWQVMYYYERFMPDGVERRSLRQWQLEDPETYPTGLPALLDLYDQVWFMHWSKDRSGFDALAATGHVQTAVITEDWLGNDLNVYRFDRIPPEDQAIATFENGMVLRDVAIIDDLLRVDLWWSAAQTLDASYTISVRLLDQSGQLVAQSDGVPFDGERPTTGWSPGEVVYDSHRLTLVDALAQLPPGHYDVAVQIYRWSPEGITDIAVADGSASVVVGAIDEQP
jgi:hypothetical protein